MVSTADTSKRYQIKGTNNGSKLHFPISAFSLSEAKSKYPTMKISSVVLITNKTADRNKAISAFKKLFR